MGAPIFCFAQRYFLRTRIFFSNAMVFISDEPMRLSTTICSCTSSPLIITHRSELRYVRTVCRSSVGVPAGT